MRARVRQVVAAILVGVAGWVAVSAARPAQEDGIRVLVAARDLPAGGRLAPGDLREQLLPTDLVPDRAITDTARAAGAVLAGPMAVGEVLTSTRVLGPGLLVGAPSDRLAVAVPVSDPAILGSLHPGDRVRILALGTGAVVAAGTVLVAQPPPSDAVGFGADPGGQGQLLAAVDEAGAAALAAAGGPSGASVGFVIALLGPDTRALGPSLKSPKPLSNG